MEEIAGLLDSFWMFSANSSSSNAMVPSAAKILPKSLYSFGFSSLSGDTQTSVSTSSSDDDASSEETSYTSESSEHCVLEENYTIITNPYMKDDVSDMVDSAETIYDEESVAESMYSAISGIYSMNGTEYTEDELSRAASTLASSVVGSMRLGDDSTRNSRLSFKSSQSRNSSSKNSKMVPRKAATIRRSNTSALKTIEEGKKGRSGTDGSLVMHDEDALREKYKEYLEEKMRVLWIRIQELAKRDHLSKIPLTDEDTQLLIEFHEKKLLLESLEKSAGRPRRSKMVSK